VVPVLGAQAQQPVKKEPSPPNSAMLMSSGPQNPVVQMPPMMQAVPNPVMQMQPMMPAAVPGPVMQMPQATLPGNITNVSANIGAVQPGAVQQVSGWQMDEASRLAEQQQMLTSLKVPFLCVLATFEILHMTTLHCTMS